MCLVDFNLQYVCKLNRFYELKHKFKKNIYCIFTTVFITVFFPELILKVKLWHEFLDGEKRNRPFYSCILVAQGGRIFRTHALPVGAPAPENKNTPLVSQLGDKWKKKLCLAAKWIQTCKLWKWTTLIGSHSMSSRKYPHVQRAGAGDKSTAKGWFVSAIESR